MASSAAVQPPRPTRRSVAVRGDFDRRSHRALHKALILTDMRLQAWGRWVRGSSNVATREVLACQLMVEHLPEEQQQAIAAHYVSGGESRCACARHAGMSERSFVMHLERARWALSGALPVLLEDIPASAVENVLST